MISFPDIVDHNPNRTLWPLESPVALFALRSKGQDKFLRPAGIQIDHKAGWINYQRPYSEITAVALICWSNFLVLQIS